MLPPARGFLRAAFVCTGGSRRVFMKVGDVVTVRVTGRRARIVDERGSGFYAIEYLPDPMSDPMDRDTVRSDEAGIYRASDLELVE
jgi:hypothetical protein